MVVTWGLPATLPGSLPCQGLLWRINRPSKWLGHVWCPGACVCPALLPCALAHLADLADMQTYAYTHAYTNTHTHRLKDNHLIEKHPWLSEWFLERYLSLYIKLQAKISNLSDYLCFLSLCTFLGGGDCVCCEFIWGIGQRTGCL